MLRAHPLHLTVLMGASALLSGCVAALIPVAAGGLLASKGVDGTLIKDETVTEAADASDPAASGAALDPQLGPQLAADPAPTLLPASRALLETLNAPAQAPEVEVVTATELPRPGTSAVGGIAARVIADNRAYDAFFGSVLAQVSRDPLQGAERQSALLLNPGKLDAETLKCGFRPPAVLIDIDPADGLVPLEGEPSLNGPLSRIVAALRSRGVTIFWVTERSADTAGDVRSRLMLSGLDTSAQDRLIVMRYPQDRKQTRRRDFATEHCVVALLGDERADFDELYDYLRTPDDAVTLERLIGTRWFLAPTPLD